jgi:radical SAM-linked protein
VDLAAARRAVPSPAFGRRARRAPPPNGAASSTRFRIRFAKGLEMRFTSHLDLLRSWERALRRADLPLAFTQGRRPHLKLSFGPPLPLGHRSRAEYFDLEFSRPPGMDLAERLNAVLPPGLEVLDYRPILFKSPSLMSQLEGASYRVRFPGPWLADQGLGPSTLAAELSRRAADVLAQERLVVRRQSEDNAREFDARPSLDSLRTGLDEPVPTLDVEILFTPRAQVRPEEVVALMFAACDPRDTDCERTALWMSRAGRRLDPFDLLHARL